MSGHDVGDVVAEREFDVVGRDVPVTVRLGRPFRDPLPGGDWGCPSQILGLGDETVQVTFGVDTLQAILLAVYRLRLELPRRADEAGVRLDWLQQPDLGLKVDPEVERLGPPGPGGGLSRTPPGGTSG